MPASPQRAPLRRDAIVETARDLVATEGLDALTLRRLAERFSVSAPALYTHFRDKSDLLRAVAERQFEALMERYRIIEASIDGERPLERIVEQCRAYVRMSRDEPELFRIMFLFPPDFGSAELAPEGSELPAATQAFRTALHAVEEAIDAGHLDRVEPMTVALSLWAATHGVADVLMLGLGLPPDAEDALVREVTGRILRGYGASS